MIFKAVGYVISLTPYAIVALTATVVANTADLRREVLVAARPARPRLGRLLRAHLPRQRRDPADLRRRLAGALLPQDPPRADHRVLHPEQRRHPSGDHRACSTRRVGVHPEVAHFTAPLGTTIGMPGCAGIWPMLIAVWGINAYGIPYTAQDYVVLVILGTVVSIGTAGRSRYGDGGCGHRARRRRPAARVHRRHAADQHDRRHGPHRRPTSPPPR